MNEFLNKEEIKRAKMCVNNIYDKINAVHTEIFYNGRSHKGYLLEKLESILHDTNCLISMCESKGSDR